MTRPDFTRITLDDHAPGAPAERAPWETPEGISVASRHDAGGLEGLDFIHGLPGIAPYHRGP